MPLIKMVQVFDDRFDSSEEERKKIEELQSQDQLFMDLQKVQYQDEENEEEL